MNKLFLIIALWIPFFVSAQEGQGITFTHASWDEILKEAERLNRPIFLDAYTAWCGPCKRMAKDVFTQKAVGEFYNANFVCAKIDMEKDADGPRLARMYEVNAYPTLLFINPKGEVKHRHMGGMSSDQFVGLGKEAVGKFDDSPQYATKYDAGDKSPALLRDYAYSLKRSLRPPMRIANEYIDTQKGQWDKPENLRFIYDFCIDADSRMFDLLVQHKIQIESLMEAENKNAFQMKVKSACESTVNKAIEYKSADLLKDAKLKMRQYAPVYAEEFALKADMDYTAKTQGKASAYASYCGKYIKLVSSENPSIAISLSGEALGYYPDDKTILKKATEWTAKAAKTTNKPADHFAHAKLLQKTGNQKKALEVAQKALDLAKQAADPVLPAVQALINELNKT
jgi:thioredoxin-related protein